MSNKHFLSGRQDLKNSFCVNHSGKMEGMISLSTSSLCNPFCVARAKRAAKYPELDSICGHCYARSLINCRSSLAVKLAHNTELWTRDIIPLEDLPIINPERHKIVRFESFGDLSTVQQATNYLNLCRVNPAITFALWTKNPAILRRALGESKPHNLIIILSIETIDLSVNESELLSRFPFVDKVFCVVSEETPDRKVNCGGRHCLTCQRCYKLDTETVITEKLK